MSVGTNIKQLRDRAGMTQEALADKLGVARSTVTQWENGWSNPRMGMVQKLAGVFYVTSPDIASDGPAKSSLPPYAILPRPSTAYAPLLGPYNTLPFNSYYCNIVMSDMDAWIENDMPD